MLRNRSIPMLLAALVLGVSFATVSAAADKGSDKKVRVLRISSVLPETHPTHKAMLYFAEKVKERTKGEIEVKVFPSSQLGEQRDALEGLKLGTLEMALT